jgi:hypothetical protein
MIKRGTTGGFIFTVVLLIAIVHSIFHFGVFGTGIQGLGKEGMSGFMVGQTDLGKEIKAATPISPVWSRIFLLVEWGFLVLVVLLFLVKRKKEVSSVSEVEEGLLKEVLPGPKKYEEFGIKTDLDKLYSIIQKQKRLRLSSVVKLFDVNKETAMNWAMTLESGNLIRIEYPRFGEPELVLEEKKDEKDEKK